MFRTAIARASATAAGGAAAAAPSQAHAWSQPHQGQHGSVRQIVKPDGSVLARLEGDTTKNEIVQDWLLTSLEQDEVVFGEEEIAAGISGMIQALGPSLPGDLLLSDGETESASGLSSETSSARGFMAAAGENMALASRRDTLTLALSDMLKKPEVQRACLEALQDSNNFAALVHSSTEQAAHPSQVVITEEGSPLLGAAAGGRPLGAAPAGGPQGEPGLAQLLRQALAALEEKASAARSTLRRVFLRAGFALHRILGRPFKAEPGEPAPDMPRFSKEWWGEVLMVLGCAVVTLLVMQRVNVLAGVAAGAATYAAAASAQDRGTPQGPAEGGEEVAAKEKAWQQTSA